MSMRDLIDGNVEVDDEENDDSFDEETGEVRPPKKKQNGHMEDSSDEEDDDDDEEAARAVWLPLIAIQLRPVTDSLFRSGKASLLTTMTTTMSQKHKSDVGSETRSAGGNVKRKKLFWTRKISI
jgi:hypothetical protein